MKFLWLSIALCIAPVLGRIENSTVSKTEIDIDKIDDTHFRISVDGKLFDCYPATPPVAHSWTYECSKRQ